MTETTKQIFEKYQIRKTKKQKKEFTQYLRSIAEREGYSFKEEKGALGANNLIVGDPSSAKVVFTAHYDTCPRLPFPNFITPKSILIYLLYQIALTIVILFPLLPLSFFAGWAIASVELDPFVAVLIAELICAGVMAALIWLLLAGPANKHTANDNTSGVTTLTDLMRAMPPELRGQAAFVFFDLEEMGLLGSAGFASKHKNIVKHKLLINFDCVSDGNNLLFALKKSGQKYAPTIEQAFSGNDSFNVEVLCKGVFYPSDQVNFKYGVGVAALKRAKFANLLYMDRIHTNRDTVYCEENIDFLVSGSIRLTELLQNGM